MVVSGFTDVYHLYTTYILPSGGLYATYHPLQEPEKSIDHIFLAWRRIPVQGFSRQIELNPKHVPCVVCSGSSASLQRLPGAEELPVNLVVVAVEPAEKNFQLLLQHAKEHAWDAEGFLPLKAISFFLQKTMGSGGRWGSIGW